MCDAVSWTCVIYCRMVRLIFNPFSFVFSFSNRIMSKEDKVDCLESPLIYIIGTYLLTSSLPLHYHLLPVTQLSAFLSHSNSNSYATGFQIAYIPQLSPRFRMETSSSCNFSDLVQLIIPSTCQNHVRARRLARHINISLMENCPRSEKGKDTVSVPDTALVEVVQGFGWVLFKVEALKWGFCWC